MKNIVTYKEINFKMCSNKESKYLYNMKILKGI
jgi:hypothetical protein